MEESTVPQLSNGIRYEDLRDMMALLEADIFRTHTRLGRARGMDRQQQAIRLDAMNGLKARIEKEISWLEQTRIPANRMREVIPDLYKAAQEVIDAVDVAAPTERAVAHLRSALAQIGAIQTE